MRHTTGRVAAVALALCAGTVVARAVDRVPRPEFDSQYRAPATATPAAGSPLLENADVLLLGGALVLAAYLAVTRRSRRGLVVLGAVSLVYFGFVREGCVCPIGALQNVALSAASSYALPLTIAATFTLPLALALWRGRVFCAGVCPAGALQDLVLLRPVTVPVWVSESLALGRHVYLGLAILLAITGSSFLICAWDPFVALFHLSGSLGNWLLLGGFVAAATVLARPYCRFLCPYGVLLGWCARLSARRARTCPAECITCRLCERSCPVGALQRPASGDAPESTAAGVRRLAVLLALAPIFIAGSAWVGARLDGTLARLHPVVSLAERVAVEDVAAAAGSTLESRTFRAGGRPAAELMEAARAIRSRFRVGGGLFGAYLGVVFSATLVQWSRRRRRQTFGPDPGACLACGRCFSACPQTRSPLPPALPEALRNV